MIDPTEHRPFKGLDYEAGLIGGQRIAIMGYSHWGEPEDEGAHVTQRVISNVIEGASNDLRFFNDIRNYFSFQCNTAFWPKVLFFNFIPEQIGVGEKRFATGTRDQNARGAARVLEIVRKYQPDKLFIFTTKGWNAAPRTIEEAAQQPLLPLAPDMGWASWGTYDNGAGRTIAIGLRHPQGAQFARMQRAVELALALRP